MAGSVLGYSVNAPLVEADEANGRGMSARYVLNRDVQADLLRPTSRAISAHFFPSLLSLMTFASSYFDHRFLPRFTVGSVSKVPGNSPPVEADEANWGERSVCLGGILAVGIANSGS